MKKMLLILFVAVLFCGCNNTKKDKDVIPKDEIRNSSLSENQSKNSENDIYSIKKINPDSKISSYLGVDFCNNYIYTLAEYSYDQRNLYFSAYDSEGNKASEIHGKYDFLYDAIYYNQKYYTIESDEDMNNYICRYSSDGSENECTALLEDFMNIGGTCGDYICCTGNGVSTLFDFELNEINKIYLSEYLDDVSSVISTVDEYGCTYFFSYDKTTEKYELIKFEADGSLSYRTADFGDFAFASGENANAFFIKDNNLYISCTADVDGQTSQYLNIVDIKSGKTIDRHEIKNSEMIYEGNGVYDISYRYEGKIYGYNLDSCEESVLYDGESIDFSTKWYFENEKIIFIDSEFNDFLGCCIQIIDSDSKVINQIPAISTGSNILFNNKNDGQVYLASAGSSKSESITADIKKSSDGINFSDLIDIEIGEISGVVDFWVDDKNNYWFICCNYNNKSSVKIYDCNGILINEQNPDISQYGIHIKSDGKDKIIFFDSENNICSINLNDLNATSGDPNIICSENPTCMLLNYSIETENKIFCYNMGDNSVYELDIVTGEMNVIINLKDYPIQMLTGFAQISDSEYILTGMDEQGNNNIYRMFHSDNECKKLMLAGVNIPPVYKEAIQNFNDSHDDINIICDDYSKYSDSSVSGYSKLDENIASGKIPDIIITDSSFDIKKYSSKNLFADLNGYIQKDDEISVEDYVDSAFTYSEYDSSLIQIIPFISSLEILRIKSDYSLPDNWTLDDFIKYANDNSLNIPVYDPETWNMILLNSYIHDNIDYQKDKCNFKTETFYQILDFIKDNSTENRTDIEETPKSMYVSDFSELFNNLLYNEAEYVNAGIPSSDNIPFIALSYNGIGISEASDKKDEAWTFIKELLNDNGQRNSMQQENIFPLNKEQLKNSMKKMITSNNNNGDQFLNSKENKQKFQELLDMFDKNIIYDKSNSKIYLIAQEEMQKFFSGEGTAKETAERIQDKVTLYLSES